MSNKIVCKYFRTQEVVVPVLTYNKWYRKVAVVVNLNSKFCEYKTSGRMNIIEWNKNLSYDQQEEYLFQLPQAPFCTSSTFFLKGAKVTTILEIMELYYSGCALSLPSMWEEKCLFTVRSYQLVIKVLCEDMVLLLKTFSLPLASVVVTRYNTIII
ncbi:hypothetical protein FF38_06710 [Lucilia cuprina]|uniref:Uncharacterized protein n=1 Tax=Lucilia cuprina TaxID=7375 RepID=A0A0L0C1M0_LUCCU|nr:hypothetical protein FF38_06710 [Lucilia cuprina]